MKASLLLPSVSVALVLATPALAQTASSQQDTQTNQNTQNVQNQHQESNAITIHKLKQDLEQAGFTDVKVLADSFVIQARDKEGNPTIMSLSPSGVFAISEIGKQKQGNASNPGAGANSDSDQNSWPHSAGGRYHERARPVERTCRGDQRGAYARRRRRRRTRYARFTRR